MLAASAPGFTGEHVALPMSPTAQDALVPESVNLLAVHCHQTVGGQVIDVGIAEDPSAMKPTKIAWRAGTGAVAWTSSTASSLWHENPPPALVSPVRPTGSDITFDPTATYQTIDGLGRLLQRTRLGRSFRPQCRRPRGRPARAFRRPERLGPQPLPFPIGASDYAITPHTLDDTAGNAPDYATTHFGIERDKEKLIPFIRAVMAIQPKLTIWGVPWSPPTWMKTNGRIDTDNGGSMKPDPRTMSAYALYFEKYIQAYRALGINLFMVAPQNEPTQATTYPGCFWTGEQLRDFLAKYLGPKLQADGMACQTWLGTPTNARRGIIDPTLSALDAAKYVAGYGSQYDAYKVIPAVLNAQPSAKIMETETLCGNHENNWSYAEGQVRHDRKLPERRGERVPALKSRFRSERLQRVAERLRCGLAAKFPGDR